MCEALILGGGMCTWRCDDVVGNLDGYEDDRALVGSVNPRLGII